MLRFDTSFPQVHEESIIVFVNCEQTILSHFGDRGSEIIPHISIRVEKTCDRNFASPKMDMTPNSAELDSRVLTQLSSWQMKERSRRSPDVLGVK
jgi:hypothetical protein